MYFIRRMAQNCVSGILCKSIRAVGSEGGRGPDFGRCSVVVVVCLYVNPFFNQGVDYAHYISLSPRIFRCSYGPEHSCCSMKTTNFSQMFPTPQKMTINSESNKLKYILLETFIIQNKNCTFFATHIYDVS